MFTRDEFEDLVADAVETLPPEILNRMDNVAVTVQDWPSRRPVVVLARPAVLDVVRAVSGRAADAALQPLRDGRARPNRLIFRGPLTSYFQTPEAIVEQVRRTVVHEIAHHFGMGEQQIARLGY